MTKKKILISLAVGLIICCLTYMWFNPFRPKYTDCGTIQHKATKDEMNKYRLEVQPYLMVQFDKSGYKAVDVTREIYHKYKEGDRICFDLPEQRSFLNELIWIIALMTLAIFLLYAFASFMYQIYQILA